VDIETSEPNLELYLDELTAEVLPDGMAAACAGCFGSAGTFASASSSASSFSSASCFGSATG
jgi:hypothetical protein